MTKVTVIGGGVSGLVCAYSLARDGIQTIIVEPEDPGGVIRTSRYDGFLLEHGPNVLLAKPHLLAFLKEIGLEDQIVHPIPSHYKQHLWCEGAVQVVPKTALSLLRSRLISPTQKIKLLRGIFRSTVIKKGAEDLSIGALFSDLLGNAAADRLFDPAFRGIFGGRIADLSARSLLPQLWDHLVQGGSLRSYAKQRAKDGRRHAVVLRSGMQSLCDRLREKSAAALTFQNDRATGLIRLGNRFHIKLESGRSIFSQTVVVATSGQTTAQYLRTLDLPLAQKLHELRFAPIAVIHFSTPTIPINFKDSFGILYPCGCGKEIMGVMFNSALFPHLAPTGQQLLTVCFGGVDHPSILARSDQELVALGTKELQQLLEIKNLSPLAICRWPRAIPQYEVGHHRIVSMMKEVESNCPGLYFIGADLGGVGIPDRIAVALDGAERLKAKLKNSKDLLALNG